MTRRIVFTNKISKDDKSKNSTLPKIQVTRFLVGTSPVNYYRHQSNSGVKLNQSKIMPAITRKPLELHMAKSMGELNDKISEKDGVINSTSPDSLLKSVDSVYKLAEKEYDRGDEEIAFILFMRVTQLLLAVKTKSNCRLDDIKYKKMSQDCIIKSEKLAESLDVRYQMISRSPTTLSSPSSVSSTLPSSSIPSINQSTPGKTFKANNNGFKDEVLIVKKNESNVDQVDCDNVIHPSIEPSDLYNMIMEMKKSKPDDIILLLDARKSQDFASSHISNLKTGQVKLLNIPEERIEKGMAMTRLLKSLPDDDQLALKARRTARKVIIFDWQSKSYSENERLHSLFDALWKWDQTKDRGNSPPILLKLGYYGWVNTYPMHTSNPKVTPPQPEDRKNEANDQIDNSYLNFYSQLKKPVEISTTIDKPKPTVNGVSHSDERDDEGDENSTVQGSNELVMRLTNTKLKDNSTKIPGSAQPVPTINREVKPKLIKNEVTPPTKSVHITKNDKLPSGITTTTETSRDPNNTTNNLASVMESEFKARRLLETAEEMDKLREKELEQLFADKESLLRENVDLKRRLKPNLSKSLDSSTAVSATGVTTSTTTSTSQSSDQGKPINFRVSQENEEEEEEREDANTKNSVSGDELFVPLRKSNTEVKRSEERTVSESSSTPRPGRSLSRSYSSPNIADHLNEDGSQGSSSSSATNNNNNKTRNSNNHQTPTFDRNLKPLSGPHSADFTRNLSSSVRSRNFSPIYGTLGHVNTGLKNLGNTCFMNAVLQCLADTTEFRRYFLQEKHMVDISRNNRLGSKGELADELGALIREIRSNQYKSVSPSDFKDAVGTHMPFFMGCEQQDAHEFLCMLLEKLHADLNRAPSVSNGVFTLPDDLPPHIAINKFWTHHLSRNQSIVSELFEGLLMSTLECKACGKQSHTFEVFTNLSLPIPTRLGHRSTIADCLDLFSDEEKLYGEAAWECPTCKVKRDASKQIKICKLPKILVIHLKRFSYEGKWRQKLQNMVDFPLVDLKLKNYRSTNAPDNFEATYDLYGVVNHYGTLEGGHYVAYCKNDEKNKWFKYDDHEVTELSTADVKSHAAYLLFYTSNH